MESDLKRVSGLWLKDGKKGKFMSGQTDEPIPGGAKLLIFRNEKKTTDKQPDYHLYAVAEEGDGAPRGQRQGNGQSRGQRQAPAIAPTVPPPPDESEIPF